MRAIVAGLALAACQPVSADNTKGADAMTRSEGTADAASALSLLCDGVRGGAPGARSALLAAPFGGAPESDGSPTFELRHPVFAAARVLSSAPDADSATVRLSVRDGAALTLGHLEGLGAFKPLPPPPINPGSGGVAPDIGGQVTFPPGVSDDGQTLCTVRAEVTDRSPVASSLVTAVTVDGGRLD